MITDAKSDVDARPPESALPQTIARIAAVVFLLTGLAAMAAPRAFFDIAATFEPYNEHFVQDIGRPTSVSARSCCSQRVTVPTRSSCHWQARRSVPPVTSCRT